MVLCSTLVEELCACSSIGKRNVNLVSEEVLGLNGWVGNSGSHLVNIEDIMTLKLYKRCFEFLSADADRVHFTNIDATARVGRKEFELLVQPTDTLTPKLVEFLGRENGTVFFSKIDCRGHDLCMYKQCCKLESR